MASGSVTVSLPQMIDLALNFPECGSVNFNLLHTVLHVVVQQLELVQCQIEFKGNGGDTVQNLLKVGKCETTIKLTEYVVSPPKDAGKIVKRKPKKSGSKKPVADKDAGQPQEEEGVIDIGQLDSHESLQTVVVVEPTGEDTENYSPCVISRKRLEELESSITDLKEKLQELAELPGNVALIEALRGAGIEKTTPVLDMFQIMTLSKRVEAGEIGMEKLASMMEDLAKQAGVADFHVPTEGTHGSPGSIGSGGFSQIVADLQQRLAVIEQILEKKGIVSSSVILEGSHDAPAASGSGGHYSVGGSHGGNSGQAGHTGQAGQAGHAGHAGHTVNLSVPDFTRMSQDEFAGAVQKELKKIKLEIKTIYDKLGMLFNLVEDFSPEEISDAIKNTVKKHKVQVEGAGATSDLPATERLDQLEDRFIGTAEQIASLDSTVNHEINNLHTQFAEMEKAFGNIMEKIHLGMPGGDSPGSGETMGELYEKLVSLQSDMESLAETANKLTEDKEDKKRLFEVLTEQIEFLKTVKADKEDLEDALADKADACAINRKVSHDQFDTACDELSRGIEEALGKLTQQEELWQQALDEIQKEIGNKLDRMELGPLRDFINNKLKMLQQRLKALTALKKETEAAGTKKFLRNVNCISCDKDVVMRKEMDPSLLPKPYALPPSRSMGPYLAYELDALRKQQKSLPNSRNLNHFETAIHQKTPRPGEDHICNRYCGGSHTITTPQQRVTRLGHFLNQWKPEGQTIPESKSREKEEEIVCIGTSNVVQQGEAMTPRVSKIGSDKKDIATKGEERRATSALSQGKRLSVSSSERRQSKSSVQKMTSPKGSAEIGEKRRSSSNAQKSRRLSQTSSKSGENIPGQQEEKVGPSLSNKIPEETPSEIEKEQSGAEDKAATTGGDQSPAGSQKPSQADINQTTSKTSEPAPAQGSATPKASVDNAPAEGADAPTENETDAPSPD